MAKMTESEWKTFLVEAPRTGKLATVPADGSPHVAPVWFDLDTDGTIVFMTRGKSAKGRGLRRDPRVAMCVDDERPPFSFVTIEGLATISEGLEEMLVWSTRIGGRYMGADLAESYDRRNAVPGELLVRVRPTKVVAEKAISD